MSDKKRWVDLLILNFCIVAFLGFVLRSKILFSLPFLDYNRLLDAHFHFAFSGWVTLGLVVLLIDEILPPAFASRTIYKWLPVAIFAGAWLLLISSPLPANSIGASICSAVFILVNYVFAASFIGDVLKSTSSKTVKLLVIAGLVFQTISSAGIFYLAYLFAAKSLNTFAYRDALYTYLHFQYNGFFILAVFALIFNRLEKRMTPEAANRTWQFALWLCISVIPSLFLTYLWRDPNETYRVIAIAGSIALLATCLLFARLAISMRPIAIAAKPLFRNLLCLALSAFLLKTLLQSGTLFPVIGNAVFGDRPVIIGFLHLVFLGFVTLFLFTWFAKNNYLDAHSAFTRFALAFFAAAIILNEAVLMTQGLGAMFIKSSYLFPWLLWFASIALFAAALLLAAARVQTKKSARL